MLLEQYHSTPETQTDESYTHPEDLEHFAHHEQIERQEAEREAKFQGVSVDEVIAQHEPHEEHQHAPEGDAVDPQFVVQDGQEGQAPPVASGPPKINRVPPPEKQDPAVRFASVKAEAENQGEWGAGDAGYKPPKSPSDKMRCVMPSSIRRAFCDIDADIRVPVLTGRTSRTRYVPRPLRALQM